VPALVVDEPGVFHVVLRVFVHEVVDDLLRAVFRGHPAPDLQCVEIRRGVLGRASAEGGGAGRAEEATELPAVQGQAVRSFVRAMTLPTISRWGWQGRNRHSGSPTLRCVWSVLCCVWDVLCCTRFALRRMYVNGSANNVHHRFCGT